MLYTTKHERAHCALGLRYARNYQARRWALNFLNSFWKRFNLSFWILYEKIRPGSVRELERREGDKL